MTINYKKPIEIEDGIFVSNNPLIDLQKMFVKHNIKRGDFIHWNIMLYNEKHNTHLYYTISEKAT